jgi:transcriptional regulator with XRE-family HTH domain
MPYSSADVAASLQEDGLAVSSSAIDQLRSGKTAGDPQPHMIEALAYFFNVDIDHFSTVEHGAASGSAATAEYSSDSEPDASTDAVRASVPHSSPRPHRVQEISISTGELGRIVVGLSEAATRCIQHSPPDHDLAERLLSLLGAVGAILTLPAGRPIISRPLLRQIIREWECTQGTAPRSKRTLERLSELLDEDR